MLSLDRKRLLEVAELSNDLLGSSVDYYEAMKGSFPDESVDMRSLDQVVLWCPGNGTAAIQESIYTALAYLPKRVYVFLSSRTPESVVVACALLQRELPETKISVVRGSREERLEYLSFIEKAYGSDHAIIYGSDEVCREVANQLEATTPRTIHGSKTSVSIVDSRKPTDLESALFDAVAAGGDGCLNTSVIYTNSVDGVVDLYHNLLDLLGSDGPTERRCDELRLSLSDSVDVLYADKKYGGLVIRTRQSTEDVPKTGVGGGTVVVVATDDPYQTFSEEWFGYEHMLSSASVSSLSGDNIETLFGRGVTRVTELGKSQSPTHNWKHDGGDFLPPLYRKARVDV